MRKIVFVVCFLLLAHSAAARDIFVDNVLGDDRRGGHTPFVTGEMGGPCQSISKALRIAAPSDRIVIANTGQPYRESITLQGPRHSGTSRYPTTIVGNGATLDGAYSLALARWQHVINGVFRTRPPHMSYQQLFRDDQPVARVQLERGQVPRLTALQWCSSDGWIYFAVEEGKLPEHYNLSCCGEQVGITLYEVHDVVIEGLTMRGFWLDGVNCYDNVRSTAILRTTARENGRSGISVGGYSRVTIEGCTTAGNGAAQLRIEGVAAARLLDNTLDETTAPALVREGGTVLADR